MRTAEPKTPLRSSSKAKLLNRPPQTPNGPIAYSSETAKALEKAKAQLRELHERKYSAKASWDTSAPAPLPDILAAVELEELQQIDDSDEGVDAHAPSLSEAVRGCFVHSFTDNVEKRNALPAYVRQLLCKHVPLPLSPSLILEYGAGSAHGLASKALSTGRIARAPQARRRRTHLAL